MAVAVKKRILVADPQLFNLATLIGTLKDNYHVVVAKNGAEVFKQLTKNLIDMVILDINFPDMDGFEICRKIKSNPSTSAIPVIFITAQNSVTNEEQGFAAGAVDFISKPFNAPTVLVRIKNQLKLSDAIAELKRLNQLALDANPNTQLPGNNSIRKEIQRVVDEQEDVCVIYADLDHFKVYNDTYGFSRGDDVIIFTADVIRGALQASGCDRCFLGHIGGDDFVFIVPTDICDKVTEEIIQRIDCGISKFYSPEDFKRGHVIAVNRDGEKKQHPLISLSMGGVNLAQRKLSTTFEVIDICTEMKQAAKKQHGSNFLLCKRQQS